MSFSESSQPSVLPRTYSIPRKPLSCASLTSSRFEDLSLNDQSGLYTSIPLDEIPHSSHSIAYDEPQSLPATPVSEAVETESYPQDSGHGKTQTRYYAVATHDDSDSIHALIPSRDGNTLGSGSDTPTEEKNQESVKVAEVHVAEDLSPQPTPFYPENFPDWRPSSLERMPTFLGIYILVILGTYSCLWAYSKMYGVILPLDSRYNWFFKYLPAFVAISIREMVIRISNDIDSILPYIAIASRPGDPIRRRHQTHFTEQEWSFRQYLDLSFQIIAYSTIVLVPIQSTVMSQGIRWAQSQTRPFMVVDPDNLIDSLNRTFVPALAMDSIWHGQPFSDLKWISVIATGYDKSNYMVIPPDYAAILPFEPDRDGFVSHSTDSETWRVNTSAIYGYLNCSQIRTGDIDVSVTAIWLGSHGLETSQLSVNLTDKEGCAYSRTWMNTSSESQTDSGNPITHDGMFAIWQPLRDHQYRSSCSPYKQFIAAGPLSVPFNNDTMHPEIKNATTGPNSGWAALSCQPQYRVIRNSVTYIIHTDNKVTDKGQDDESTVIELGDGDFLDNDDQINGLMVRNFLNNSLVYNLSSPVFSRTFWNKPEQNSFGPLKDVYDTWYDGFDTEGCRTVSNSQNYWDNNMACQMYANVATLWPLLVSGTMSLSALYTPLQDQKREDGKINTYRKGWYLTLWELIYTIVLHGYLLLLLSRERVLHLPDWFRFLVRFAGFARHGKSKYRTGLYGTPFSIAGRAFVFQDKTMQILFEGLDMMSPSRAKEELSRRFSESELELRIWPKAPSESIYTPYAYECAMIKRKYKSPDCSPKKGRISRVRSRLASLNKKIIGFLNRKKLKKYGRLPKRLNRFLVVVIMISCIGILVTTYEFIIKPLRLTLRLWYQPTYTSSLGFKDDMLRYLQKLIFRGLPTLILALLGWWWEHIEQYYRATQPYARLAKGANGRMSVCLDYIHSIHFVVALKALLNHHFWLAFVATGTVVVKMATVLASGLFAMGDFGSLPGRELKISRDWRPPGNLDFEITFKQFSQFKDSLRQFAMSRAIFDYPERPGWQLQSSGPQTEEWVLPSVKLEEQLFFNLYNHTGYSGSVNCTPVDINLANTPGQISATITGGECQGNKWDGICSAENNPHNSLESLQHACMGWQYLNESACYGNVGGRWWIVSLMEPLPNSVALPEPISLLCEPHVYMSNLDIIAAVSINEDDNQEVWLSLVDSTQRIKVPADQWNREVNGLALNFDTYAAKLLTEIFADQFYWTNKGMLDCFSMMCLLGSINRTDLFHNRSTLELAVSSTYTHVFAALIGQSLVPDQTNETETILLRMTAPENSSAHLVIVSPLSYMALVDPRPLLVTFGIILLYFIAALVITFSSLSGRRTPLNISYAANAMTMVYDSQLMERIRKYGDPKSDYKDLDEEQFAIGEYQGLSGEMRRGIDFEHNVSKIRETDLVFHG